MKNVKLEVLYEDEWLLVINKSAGVATQTDKVGEEDIETLCRKYRKSKGENSEVFIVHRLDQPVSGILAVAKTKEIAAVLSKGISEEYMKDYKAEVYLEKELPPKGRLEDYLVKDSKASKAIVVGKENKCAKKATLSYEIISRAEKTASLKVHLETGRFHQIRAQLSNAGAPILGDQKYGSENSIAFSRSNEIRNVCLCAYHLAFTHPQTGKKMEFSIIEK